jgi:hypothetical protein
MFAALFSTFVALVSHVIAGGTLPGTLGIVVPLVFSILACVLLAGRQLSLLRLSLSVAISQLLFHTLFVLGASGGTSAASVAPLPAGHAALGHAALGQAGAGHGTPGQTLGGQTLGGQTFLADASGTAIPEHCGHDAPWMWIAHVIAGIITIAVLHLSETIVRGLVSGKKLVLSWLVPTLPALGIGPLAAPHIVTGHRGVPPIPLGVFASSTSRRGPPALAFS